MSDSTQCLREVSCTKSRECCDKHSDHCSEHGAEIHVHVHVHAHHACCSSVPIKRVDPVDPVALPVTLPVIQLGFSENTIIDSKYSNFKQQVEAPSNYGPAGIYKKVQAVNTANASADILGSPVTAAELKARYDVLLVGLFMSSFTAADAIRLKEYAERGGVILLVCDHSPTAGAINVLQQFGHVGTLTGTFAQSYTGVSSTTEYLNTYFGDSSGIPLKGSGAFAISAAQLPAGSRVLATVGTNVLAWTVGGTLDRVVAVSDINLVSYDITGTAVDTGQEVFLNNMMAYLFDQALKSA
ncbi:hypothetical protein ACMSI6_20475 [Pseudomonas antarctica]|uniref:hypothetical protein n=1 Tax=Pseudomonas antarctica TaxID=219572 RepID=UPI0039C1C6C8